LNYYFNQFLQITKLDASNTWSFRKIQREVEVFLTPTTEATNLELHPASTFTLVKIAQRKLQMLASIMILIISCMPIYCNVGVYTTTTKPSIPLIGRLKMKPN
jgi:hypothetical protein